MNCDRYFSVARYGTNEYKKFRDDVIACVEQFDGPCLPLQANRFIVKPEIISGPTEVIILMFDEENEQTSFQKVVVRHADKELPATRVLTNVWAFQTGDLPSGDNRISVICDGQDIGSEILKVCEVDLKKAINAITVAMDIRPLTSLATLLQSAEEDVDEELAKLLSSKPSSIVETLLHMRNNDGGGGKSLLTICKSIHLNESFVRINQENEVNSSDDYHELQSPLSRNSSVSRFYTASLYRGTRDIGVGHSQGMESGVDQKLTKSSQTGRISNTKCPEQDVLLVDPYDFSRDHRGYMIIIVNETFKRQAFRHGADKDEAYLSNIAYKLRLTVYKGKTTNMSFTETKQLLEDVMCLDHSDSNMLVVAFSTHGLERPNPKAEGKCDHALVCSDDRWIFTSTITEMFNDDNCPSLKNKPKLFIIQACRGEEHDSGADLLVSKKAAPDLTCGGNAETQRFLDDSDVHFAMDSWARGPVHLHDDFPAAAENESSAIHMVPQFTSTQLVDEPLGSSPQFKPFPFVDTPSLKCENDQLVFYAIPPGMLAWRNTEKGSWMLYYLNKLVKKCDGRRPVNILKLLLKVNAKMALRTTNAPYDTNLDKKKAISVVEHKLTRDLIFPPLGDDQ
ncbi:uncharacterized protein LOC127871176 [Dreissena polymorpha]|uniref:uncharacterized protein LOC127871176 n=1 Tax=Dreissena polymorpha TaxID=45954 RepID=UPI002264ABE0|nr:uncharacterized protein LOC127871176 [Dreissena polymorpha]